MHLIIDLVLQFTTLLCSAVSGLAVFDCVKHVG